LPRVSHKLFSLHQNSSLTFNRQDICLRADVFLRLSSEAFAPAAAGNDRQHRFRMIFRPNYVQWKRVHPAHTCL
jgi:hypothetical protein